VSNIRSKLLVGSILCPMAMLASTTASPAQESVRPLSMFLKSNAEKPCYDRTKLPQTSAVDAHLHAYPFGGKSALYTDLMEFLNTTKTRFVMLMGIGQTLPFDGQCTYYKDCPGTPVKPSIRNDFNNAANQYRFPRDDIEVGVSMTFPDLANPADIVEKMQLLDTEYPHLYVWMGEVNVYKEALLPNGFVPPTPEDIAGWKDAMEILRERGIPLGIHLDLGNDDSPTQNLHLLDEVLRQYPDNKIVWMHLGLSGKEIRPSAEGHIKILTERLEKYPHLSIDLSAAYYDGKTYFDTPEKRAAYVKFLNSYPTRLLPGSDFVASEKKTAADYERESLLSFDLFPEIDDTAFRNIALGQNYFNITPKLSDKYEAPQICTQERARASRPAVQFQYIGVGNA